MDSFGKFPLSFQRETFFETFNVLSCEQTSEKVSSLKRKEFAPQEKIFPCLEQTPSEKGGKDIVKSFSPLLVYPFPPHTPVNNMTCFQICRTFSRKQNYFCFNIPPTTGSLRDKTHFLTSVRFEVALKQLLNSTNQSLYESIIFIHLPMTYKSRAWDPKTSTQFSQMMHLVIEDFCWY